MSRKIRIGMVGCGVVGTGVLRILEDNATTIAARLGAPIEVGHIVVRRLEAERDPIVPRNLLGTDPSAILEDPKVDVLVEVMGGVDEAGKIVRAALEKGKHVVTANKALLAEHGDELLERAEAKHVDLYFEAAVAGGIPILRVLREGLASDRILALRGIVNGTSNYVLSRMQHEGIDFDVALRAAQAAGYAEADPTLDVGGGDACHKLAILATLAFGARLHPSEITTEGIDRVDATDIRFADRLGFVIKPIAAARMLEGPRLDLRVHPALIPKTSVLASITGALNAVYVEGERVGPCLLSGLGAGAAPTAMSVVSDIVDVGRNLLTGAHNRVPSRSFRGESLTQFPVRPMEDLFARYYLRFQVADRPGVLGKIATLLGEANVSIEQMFQHGTAGDEDESATVVVLTHLAREGSVKGALAKIDRLDEVVVAPTRLLRVED